VFSAFVIALREGLEAALIVSLVLAAVSRAGAAGLVRSIWYGVISAIGVSLAAGLVFTIVVGSLPGEVEQTVAGVASLVAVAVLTFMVFWMRGQAGQMAAELDARVAGAAAVGSGWALGLLAFSAVLREGLETALFLFASLKSASTSAGALGAVLGLVAAVALGYALFRGSVNLDLRAFFRVTGLVLVVVGAGLLAAGIHELQGVGIVPVGVAHLWDARGILDDGAGVGAVLHGLLGYNAAPSLVEVVAYWVYLVGVGFLFLRPSGKRIGHGGGGGVDAAARVTCGAATHRAVGAPTQSGGM
jgi:high-affinity iron transporter